MNKVNYIRTDDPEIIKRFLQVVPTKYLLSSWKNSRKSTDDWFSAEVNYSQFKYISYNWSFSKDENYQIIIERAAVKAELDKRPNINIRSGKVFYKNLQCNNCHTEYDFKINDTKKFKEFVVFRKPYSIEGWDLVCKGKIDFSDETPIARFTCPECGEIFTIKLDK